MNQAALIVLMAVSPALFAADRFVLDPEHTFPSFEIRHQKVSLMRGKFNRSQGQVVLDPLNPGGNLIEVTVDASSGDTGHDELNRKLLGGNFFNTARFPDIRFVARDVSFKDGIPISAQGELTMLGVTRPMVLEIREFSCGRHFPTFRNFCGADVHTTLRRSDFGMNYGIPLIGDEVKLAIEVEGFRE
ncbi:MAG: YceI family protein [Thiobacillus sp.]